MDQESGYWFSDGSKEGRSLLAAFPLPHLAAQWMLIVRVFGLASSDFGMVTWSTPFT